MRKSTLLIVFALVIAACAPGSQSTLSRRPTATPREAALSTPSASSFSAEPNRPEPSAIPTEVNALPKVTMAFAGDVHFEGNARGVLSDPGPLIDSLRDTVGDADFAVANLETAIGVGGQPMPGKQYTFRAPPTALKVLASTGFDAVSMANNHAVDFGEDVFAQTLRTKRQSPLPIVGIGGNAAEAFTPVEVKVGDARIAILASSQVRDLTGLKHAATPDSQGIASNVVPDELLKAVTSAAKNHDIVVVVMHWGTEQSLCADDRQRQTAVDLAASGADIIVGGHGHRPQGSGWLGLSYVAYGLGNFIWYQNGGGNGESGVLKLAVDTAYASATTGAPGTPSREPRRRSVVTAASWIPMRIGSDGVPRKSSASLATTATRAWDASASCGGLARESTASP